MTRTTARATTALLVVAALAAACTEDDGGGGADAADDSTPTTQAAVLDVDLVELGLWDDGPCDAAAPPLVIGLMTVFESAVVSLEDQAVALKASAEAFNARGGANGACIEVHTCDDRNDPNQAVECVREIDEAGVVATVNDVGTAAPEEVSDAMAAAGIPRIASNVSSLDWDDQNAYPTDPSGMGGTFMHPGALLASGVESVGLIRVDVAGAAALSGLLGDIFADDGLTIPYDVPVPAGTTDYSQFVIGAESAGVGGISLSLGEQEAIQIIRAAQQLGSELPIAIGVGSFSHDAVAALGDFAEQLIFDGAFPPATFDLPVYEVVRADLAASGDERLQPGTVKANAVRSWIGLYALLHMIRDAGLTEFTRPAISSLLQGATDVPMLGIYGDDAWTPNVNSPGLFQRTGLGHYGVYRWDPDAPAPDGLEGNFVQIDELDFLEVLCGSPLGAPEPC